MTPRPLKKALVTATGLTVLFLYGATSAWADCPSKVNSSADGPLRMRMLVLGDSIMWGQGLKQEQKFWWRVKCWLEEKTGREVTEKVMAHSGAHLDSALTAPPKFSSNNGEVNLPFPTVNQQLDLAREFYGSDRLKVDLVLVDGCVNDVGVSNLLDATTAPDSLPPRIIGPCLNGMHALLRRITSSFPNSQVLVTGYYRFVSSETDDNAFLRQLVKKISSGKPEARRMTDKQMRDRLITISELWYKVSTASLKEAVEKVNAELRAKDLPPAVTFVEIGFSPEHSFAAANTLLWTFVFGSTNLSGFRKVIVTLSFGTAAYKPDDDVRESRVKSCNETFKLPKGIKESKLEKRSREDDLLICRYASLGHPNQMGALIYTEAIKGKLQWLIDKAAKKRNALNPQ
ncbi:MAG: SGNH/GDSL hydrolase family protein [Pyrinomonadaceae bacterium]|nr:SGNH/GDSL hydrolase family protein [Pyrinomonadaceae bacterium]